jgi:hypothetical protein
VRVPITRDDEPSPQTVDVERLIAILAGVPHQTDSPKPYFNPWCGSDDLAVRRRGNLIAVLEQRQRAGILLVAEAPGHLGARKSGVPLTDPLTLDSSSSEPAETTATRIYRTLRDLQVSDRDVLMWNIFPFHPFKSGHPATNRTVLVSEARLYADLAWLFAPSTRDLVVAVGRKAEKGLRGVGIPFARYLPHPSRTRYYPAFRDGLGELVESLPLR